MIPTPGVHTATSGPKQVKVSEYTPSGATWKVAEGLGGLT